MSFTLEKVVPWGRSFEEYLAMFDLSEDDLAGHILGCGDGPAGFNAVLTRRGGSIVSADPIYGFTADEIQGRLKETYEVVLDQIRMNMQEFVWRNISSVDELGRVRMDAMRTFLGDFEAGRFEGRYINAELPSLPFKDEAFDLALCSHFLFLYSKQHSQLFHLDSIRELCRVARQVRIFPIIELGSSRSRHLDQVVAALESEGYTAIFKRVLYEFQRGGNEMLQINRGFVSQPGGR